MSWESTVDFEGLVFLPGFVETHWHMWNTLLRGKSGGYFDSVTAADVDGRRL